MMWSIHIKYFGFIFLILICKLNAVLSWEEKKKVNYSRFKKKCFVLSKKVSWLFESPNSYLRVKKIWQKFLSELSIYTYRNRTILDDFFTQNIELSSFWVQFWCFFFECTQIKKREKQNDTQKVFEKEFEYFAAKAFNKIMNSRATNPNWLSELFFFPSP